MDGTPTLRGRRAMDNGFNERGGWSVERKLSLATFILSALAFTFGLGVNWQRQTQTQADLKAHVDADRLIHEAVSTTYVRQDVYGADQRNLIAAIDRLTQQLSTLESRRR